MKKFISWRRVSTKKQGSSGLGLQAQKDIIDHFVKQEGGELLEDYCEVYTGKDLNGCTELRKAMAACKEHNAILIIAKTDRFRNCREALDIYEQMNGKIFFCDLPSSDKFTLTLFFALAEREALLVSIRTKQALAVKKAQGVKLGRPKGVITATATHAATTRRKQEAKNKPCNKAIWNVVKKCTDNFRELTTANFAEASILLQQMGVYSSTGQILTKERVRNAYYNLRGLYTDYKYIRPDSVTYKSLIDKGVDPKDINKKFNIEENKEV